MKLDHVEKWLFDCLFSYQDDIKYSNVNKEDAKNGQCQDRLLIEMRIARA